MEARRERAFAPEVGAGTRVLVLGSLPGAESLRQGQYYAHPRNQFWPIVGDLFGMDLMRLPYAQRVEMVREREPSEYERSQAEGLSIEQLRCRLMALMREEIAVTRRLPPHVERRNAHRDEQQVVRSREMPRRRFPHLPRRGEMNEAVVLVEG